MIKLKDKYLLSKNLDKIKDKKVLVRVDLNIESFRENYRIKVVKELLKYLKSAKQVVFISHFDNPLINFPRANAHNFSSRTDPLGTPAVPRGLLSQPRDFAFGEDQAREASDKFSRGNYSRLKTSKETYAQLSLQRFIKYFPHFKFFNWEPGKKLPNDKYLLLENLRFFAGEEKNDLKFAKSLAKLSDIYINEAFSVSHRKHASIIGIPKFLPSYFGINFEKEINQLNKVFLEKKLAIVIGGAKIKTKLPLIKKFSKKADLIVLGGLIAKEFLRLKIKKNNKILIPKNIGKDTDIESIKIFLEKLKKMKLIVWSGVFGKVEDKRFIKGTLLFAKGLAKIDAMNFSNSLRPEIKTRSVFHKNFRIVGGGSVLDFIQKYNLQNKFSFVSSGGGAMLDYLAKETLPGIEAIIENN